MSLPPRVLGPVERVAFMDGTAGSGRELCISRVGEDKAAALGVEAILRAAGYATFLQDRDFAM